MKRWTLITPSVVAAITFGAFAESAAAAPVRDQQRERTPVGGLRPLGEVKVQTTELRVRAVALRLGPACVIAGDGTAIDHRANDDGSGTVKGVLKLTAVPLRTDTGTRVIDMKHVRRVTFQRDPNGNSQDLVELSDKEIVRGRVTADAGGDGRPGVWHGGAKVAAKDGGYEIAVTGDKPDTLNARQVIVATGSLAQTPNALKAQLKPGGRLVYATCSPL